MSMFCYQCQEAANGKGCQVKGVCGKNEDVAKLQDLLIYSLKGISDIVVKADLDAKDLGNVNHEVLKSLFMTITNANFDEAAFEQEIKKIIALRNNLREMVDSSNNTNKPGFFEKLLGLKKEVNENKLNVGDLNDAALFEVTTRADMLAKAATAGVLATEDEDVRSLRELIVY
ncbi:MAG: hypothetical protein AAGU75_10955, partial [Bacillota bacterium]